LNAALMSAEQPSLEKRSDVVDAGHRHVSRIGASPDYALRVGGSGLNI